MTTGVMKREGIIFLSCFLLAMLLNMIRVIALRLPVSELFIQVPALLVVSSVMYGAAGMLRVLYAWMARFWNRK